MTPAAQPNVVDSSLPIMVTMSAERSDSHEHPVDIGLELVVISHEVAVKALTIDVRDGLLKVVLVYGAVDAVTEGEVVGPELMFIEVIIDVRVELVTVMEEGSEAEAVDVCDFDKLDVPFCVAETPADGKVVPGKLVFVIVIMLETSGGIVVILK